MPSDDIQRVSIAVVQSQQKVIVGVRQPHQSLAQFAEFPGGKALAGETSEQTALRECYEETGIRIECQQELHRTTFEYPHATVELTFWWCRLAEPPLGDGSPPTPNGNFRWVDIELLPQLDFPPANLPVLKWLQTLQNGSDTTQTHVKPSDDPSTASNATTTEMPVENHNSQ